MVRLINRSSIFISLLRCLTPTPLLGSVGESSNSSFGSAGKNAKVALGLRLWQKGAHKATAVRRLSSRKDSRTPPRSPMSKVAFVCVLAAFRGFWMNAVEFQRSRGFASKATVDAKRLVASW